MRHLFRVFTILFAVILAVSCSTDSDDSAEDTATSETDETGSLAVSSSSITDGVLPDDLKCTRDGGDGVTAPLAWTGAPEGTASFAVMMYHYPANADTETDDPSTYWLLWGVPSTSSELSRGNTEEVGYVGSDKDNVDAAYTAPCSPGDATNSYTIRVYALSEVPDLPTEDSVDIQYTEFMAAISDITLDYGDLDFTN